MANSVTAEPSSRPSQQIDADFDRAIALRESGEFDASLRLLEAVMAFRIEKHGRDHLDSHCALSQYGRTLRTMGRLQEAQTVHWEVLLIRERVYGPTADYTTNSAGILEETLRLAGNNAAADLLQLAKEFANMNYPVSFRGLQSTLASQSGVWPGVARVSSQRDTSQGVD